MLGVLKSGPNTTTTTKGFGQTLSHARYSFLQTALSFWKKVDMRQGFAYEETTSPKRLKGESPRE